MQYLVTLTNMSKIISVNGLKQEARSLLSAIGASGGNDCLQWMGQDIDVAELTVLVISNANLSGLSPFMCFTRLTVLNLSFNSVTDISGIGALTMLKEIDLSHNKISDLGGLKGLNALTSLRCNNNLITSVEPVGNLSELIQLWISCNNISWESIIHLQGNCKLKDIVLYSNPCESKLKLKRFLMSICSSLETIDGVAVGPGDASFLSTVDGRVMLTQARAQLTVVQRENLIKHEPSLTTTKSLQALTKSNIELNSIRSDTFRASASAGSNMYNIRSDDSPPQPLTAVNIDDSVRTRVFKARHKSSHSGIGQRYSKAGENLFIPAEGDVEHSNLSATDSDGPDQNASKKEAITIYFGHSPKAPVALCLFSNGTGYARWARAGSVACSYEAGGRLFSSHKSGALAAVVAPDGSGSVMDDCGNCMLSLKAGGEAIVYNLDREIELSFQRPKPSAVNSAPSTAFDPITIFNGLSSIKDKKIDLKTFRNCSDKVFSSTFRWMFADLIIDFTPATWEVMVHVSNGKVQCCFSSNRGGSLLLGTSACHSELNIHRITYESLSYPIDKNIPASSPAGKASRKKDRADRVSKIERDCPLMSTEEHDSLRSGIQSIMSQMDQMIADIKLGK